MLQIIKDWFPNSSRPIRPTCDGDLTVALCVHRSGSEEVECPRDSLALFELTIFHVFRMMWSVKTHC